MQYKAHIKEANLLIGEILDTKAPADRIISYHFKQNRFIGSKDKASISSLVYDVLRNKAFLEFYLSTFNLEYSPRTYLIALLCTIKKHPIEEIKDFFDSSKYAEEELDTDELLLVDNFDNSKYVDLSKILDSQKMNYPEWAERYLKETLKDEHFEEHMNALNQKADVVIRANTLKISRDELIDSLAHENISTEKTKLSPWGLKVLGKVNLFNSEAFRNGYFEVQDEGSQILALLAETKPKQRVLDMCCGAGGKLLALGASMENTGTLLGTDINERRLFESKKRLRRSGLNNASLKVISSENDKYLKRQNEKFDVVFVDAPCSGTGTWRRNPDSKWKLEESFVKELTKVQASILEKAGQLVKPGGRLIYATCSLFKDENDNQADNFINNNDSFEQVDLSQNYPELTKNKSLQLTPFEHDCDGFFTAVFEKKC